ncbi:uncharacterized protein H6S33_005012 [Morchella sextelata]|uniref:uncharacterized protein n=1 Tax=Morchella sextelata TaxID=1174677 RepID=UPI001D05BC65|nr:uncharacterized protein H6S33_005012 [Morchella sextelata]KAH0605030.1 hypothetical protein H6S33_005012 [Morchella sextelata]
MSFHLSSSNIRVESHDGRTYLCAHVNGGGDDRFCLDDHIGNNDGHFAWDGKNFTSSARNVRFSCEGGANVPILRAELRDSHDNWHDRDLNLAERITNHNGKLAYQ